MKLEKELPKITDLERMGDELDSRGNSREQPVIVPGNGTQNESSVQQEMSSFPPPTPPQQKSSGPEESHDYDSEITQPNASDLTISSVTAWLTDIIQSSHELPTLPRRPPFALQNPDVACKAIAKTLVLYATIAPPQDSQWLFDENQSLGPKFGRGPLRQTWYYLTKLGKSKYFQTMASSERQSFARKMASIMRRSGYREATPNGNTVAFVKCQFGWTLGFWLSRLYNAQGVDDAGLPVLLQTTKQRFLEHFGGQFSLSNLVLPYPKNALACGSGEVHQEMLLFSSEVTPTAQNSNPVHPNGQSSSSSPTGALSEIEDGTENDSRGVKRKLEYTEE